MTPSPLHVPHVRPERPHLIARWVNGGHGPAGWVLLARGGMDWFTVGFPPQMYPGPAHTPPAWIGEWAAGVMGWPAGRASAARVRPDEVDLPEGTPVIAVGLSA